MAASIPEENKNAMSSSAEEHKTKMWKVRPKSGGSWLIVQQLAELGELLGTEEEMDEEEREFELVVVYMSQEEIENLGEWDGW